MMSDVVGMFFAFVFFAATLILMFSFWGGGEWYAEAVRSDNEFRIAREQEKTAREVAKTERRKVALDSFSDNLPMYIMAGVIVLILGGAGWVMVNNNKMTEKALTGGYTQAQAPPVQQQPQYTAFPVQQPFQTLSGPTVVDPQLLLKMQNSPQFKVERSSDKTFYYVTNVATEEIKKVTTESSYRMLGDNYG